MQPQLNLVSFGANDLPVAYSKFRSAMIAIIDEAFGWNEEFQNERFRNRYDLNWFYWVEIESERIGYICIHEKSLEIHISLLIVEPEERNLGYGRLTMAHIHKQARQRGCKVTLSSFRNNESAIRFYEKLGYTIVGGDEHFVDMAKNSF